MNYISIQFSHTVPSKGYRQSSIRTGYEYLMPYKDSGYFCLIADRKGKVLDITKHRIEVEYEDGEKIAYQIGTVLGQMEGVTYRHEIITDLKAGQTFKEGEPIYYHRDFYERDWLDNSRLVFKTGKPYTVAIMMADSTYEDSSGISRELMQEMTTSIAPVRKFVIDFRTNITNLVKEGDELEPNTPLYVDIGVSEGATNLAEASISMIENLASASPVSTYKGSVERIEVKYNGDIEDMTPTLQAIVKKLDREGYERTKGTEYECKDNRVDGNYMSKNGKLDLDYLELSIYIATDLEMGVGDKHVLGNQAKTVVGQVYDHSLVGEVSGDKVHAKFAYVGFVNRIIDSPFRQGVYNRIIRLAGVKAADIYFGKSK